MWTSRAITSEDVGLTDFRLAVDGSGLARPEAGIGTYTRELLMAMKNRRPGHVITVFVPAGVEPPAELSSLEVRPIPQARFAGRHLAWPRQLRQGRYSAYFSPAGLLPLGSVGAPAVVTVHDLAIYRHPEWFPPRQPFSTKLLVPRSIRLAKLILADSNHTAKDLDQLFGVGAERTRIVHPGVSRRFHRLDEAQLREAKDRLRVPERFILFVGAIEPRKNIPTLLQAWSQMGREPALVVAGGLGWRYDEVKQHLDQAGPALVRLGTVPPGDLPALYNLASCLAHPAWYEGFGLTPLEAMACGTPVVASSATSLPEVVGDAAVTVAPGNVQGWRTALERVLGEREFADRLRRKGLLRAAEFRWERAAEEAWAAIESVVPRPPAGTG